MSNVRPVQDHYILPSEFALLVAFWFGPPWAIAAVVQFKLLSASRSTVRPLVRWLVLAGTPLVSLALGVGTLVASPPVLRFLGVVDIQVFGLYLPFLPLAYVSVAIVAAIAVWLAVRGRALA
jgi:hypothetical protein